MAKQVTSIGLSVLFTLLLLLAVVSASPLRKRGCQGKKSAVQLHYESGHTYVYNFEGHTVSSLPGQQGDGVKLNLKSTAEISIKDNCQAVLKLKGLQITGPDSQKYTNLNEEDGDKIEFDLEAGVVGRDIISTATQSENIVNIMKGILSLFNIPLPTDDAARTSGKTNVLDVFGLCPTDISITERGSSAYVTRFRNLNNCQLRENLRQDFASVTYHVDSDLQTTPLLEATHEVKQQLKGGVLTSAESHEKYLYKPFSNQDAGAKTLVESKLTLVSHSKIAAPTVSGNTVHSIVFEPPHVHIGASNAAAVIDALHKAHEAMPQYVGETAAREFANVVHIMQQTSKDDLLSVYGQVKSGAGFKDKAAGQKMFLDALFRAGTGPAVEVAVELLKSNKITGPAAELYYLQFAYTKYVTKSALTAAVTLLDLPGPSKLVYLGVGALGGRYCSQYTCDGVPEVDAFLEKLSEPLNSGCKVSSYDEETKVIASLKALHNVHHLNDAVINKLKTCVLDDHVPIRVRAAVLDVFQSDACKVKDTSLEVLKNIQLDSELRIKAFLALIECPCNKMANPLKELLDAEPSNQVGSFITSYLRNLRASTNPSKEHQKAVYGEIRTIKRFPIDFRKFSSNFEHSYMLGGLNVGATAESNLIYSQKSFLPRASTLNLTTDLFGHSINFLEVEVRQENLDQLAEAWFGPRGYFSTHSLAEVVKYGKEKWTDIENTTRQRLYNALRSKRSVTKEDLYGVQEKSTTPYSSEPAREILIDLSARLFGAEVGWLPFHHNAKDAANEASNSIFRAISDLVIKLKDFDYNLRQHNTFLDTELVYPTGLGFPLKLVVTGSSAVHVELDGKIDIERMLNDFKSSPLHLKFVPSAAIEIVGAFEVDASVVEAGLKVSTTLHTATGTDIVVKSTDGVGIDVTLGLPVQKQDVLTVKTEVLSTVRERGKPEVDKEIVFPGTPKRNYHGCFDQLSRLVGITFCGTLNFPWDPVASKAAFFPLNGPSKLSLVIENEDVTRYHFRASINDEHPYKKSLELLLETPGSQTDRKLSLLLERIYQPYQGLKAQLSSPWKQVSGELAFTDSDKELSLLAKATNDADEYYVKLGASVTGDPNHATYHPLLEYKTPEKHASLVAKKGAKGKPERLTQPFSVSGSVTVDKTPDSRKYTFNDVIFNTPQGEYKVEGSVAGERVGQFSTDLKIHYGNHFVILKSAYKHATPGIYHFNFNVQPSQTPDFGINLTWDWKRSKNDIENSLVVVHGSDPDNADARFTLNQAAHYDFGNLKSFDISTKNKVTYPLLGIVGKFDGSLTPSDLHINVEASYEKHKFESELTAKTGIHKKGDYDINFHASVLDNSLKFETKREVVAPHESKFTTELEIHPGGKYTLVADVTHVFERNDINFKLNAVANVYGQANEYKLDSALIYNQNLFDTHYKLTVGNVEYVDISANFKRAPNDNPSGNAKIFLKNYLVANAQFKYASGKGSATLNVDIPKIGRKLKGTGDLQVTGTHHVATVEIYYNADKNPNQKLTFHTDTDFRKDALDSKNELNILNYVTVVNVKGTLTGKLEDGQLKGDFDIALPNNYKFAGKLDQTLHVRPTNSEGDVNVELTVTAPQDSQSSKITLEFAAKNVDTKQYSFDGQSKLAYHSSSGKDAAIIVAAKNIPQREQRVIEGQGVLQGSLIGETLRVEFNSEFYEPYITYKGHGSYGTGTVVDLNGKVSRTLKYHDNHYTGPFLVDGTVEVKLPFEKVKYIKDVYSITGEAEEKKLQFKYFEAVTVNDDTYRIDVDSLTELDKGNNKIVLTLPNSEPKTYVSSWYFSPEDYNNNGLVKGGFSLSGTHDSKLIVDVTGKRDWSDLNLHATLHTPLEKVKNAELTLKNKYIPSLEVDTDFILVVDEKKFTVVNKVTSGPFPGLPNIDFTATHPEGTTRVYFVLQSKSNNDVSGKAELEWATNGGGKLTASGKANYESVQNFRIEADVESPKLNIKKWHVVLANKPTKTSGKTIQILATEAGAQVINGKLEYHIEDKENSYKAGVSGNVKVRNQQQPLKADVFFNKFTPAEHGELGAESGISIHLGEKSFEATTKYTNKESRASVSYCFKKEQCSVSEVHSVIKVTDFNHFQHEFGATVDLRTVGVNEGFVLAGKTVNEPKSFDHTVGLKLLNGKQTTYNLHSYLNEHEVGVVLTLPQRVIASEGKLSYVKEKGERKLDLGFWLDKERHPENKAGLNILVVFHPTKDGTELRGDVKLSHPALQKAFSVTSKAVVLQHNTLFDGTADFDIFAKSNQKITLEAKYVRNVVQNGYNVTGYVRAKGKLLDVTIEGGGELSSEEASYRSKITYQDEKHKTKNAEVSVFLTLHNQHIYVKSPTAELLKFTRNTNRRQNEVEIHGEVFILGMQPIEFEEVITLPVTYKATFYLKNKPNEKLIVDSLHDIMKGFNVRLTRVHGGASKDVLYVGVDLTDQHFLRTHFTWSTTDLKSLAQETQHEVKEAFKQSEIVSKDFADEVTNELQGFLESLKKAQPDLQRVVSSYKTQLNELKEELENDEGFTEASENVKKLIKAVTKVVLEITKRVTELADVSLEVFGKVRTAVQETLSKFLPKLKEIYLKFVEILNISVVRGTVDFTASVIEITANFIKEHEDELKKIVEMMKDFFEDVGKVVGTTIVQVRNEVVGFVKLLLEQLKALPAYATLKEHYNNFITQLSRTLVPEHTWSVIKEVIGPFKDSLPTHELRDFVTAVEEYLDKHLKKETVNDAEELQALLNKAIKALKSLIALVTDHLPKGDPAKEAPSFLGLRLPVAVNALFEFPKVVALRYSPFLYLTSGNLRELPTLQEFLLTLKPSLNPKDWVPPYRAHGVVIQLEHFVTLDGRHFTFKGTCAYVLLQDVVDGNFSVALDYATKSLIFADRHDTVELFQDSKIKVNGEASEFPYLGGDFAAWKDFGSVNLVHKAGLYVKCDSHYSYCFFYVNGYYFGKTQGLLGVLDYEPFDDFRKSNGQVVTDVNEFGNSWKVNPSCGDVSGPTHHDHHMAEPAECSSLFGGNSPLKLGYLVTPVAPYREACTHIVADATTADAKKQAACAIAAAYVTSARSQYFPIYLPAECVHCSVVGGNPVQAKETVSVRVPQKAADVVIVVEQVTTNSEVFKDLINPLVTTLTAELKAKGIVDVHFTLIGYGDATHNYPAVYTSSGKLSFEGKTKNIKFTDHEDPFNLNLDSCDNGFKYLKAVIESELGLGAPSRAYQFASTYPFKIATSKVLIGVVGTTKTSAFPLSLQYLGALYSTKVLRDRGVAFHLVAPVEDLHLDNSDSKTLKSVVGFDSDRVFVLGDSKRKEIGNADLRKHLSYKNNIWIPIALESYGTTYVAQNFVDAKPAARKQFLQVFSHRIVDSLLTPLHQDCKCKLVNGIHPFSECKVTSRVEREHLAAFTKGGKGVKG